MKSKCCNAELKPHPPLKLPEHKLYVEYFYCSKCGLMYHSVEG